MIIHTRVIGLIVFKKGRSHAMDVAKIIRVIVSIAVIRVGTNRQNASVKVMEIVLTEIQ